MKRRCSRPEVSVKYRHIPILAVAALLALGTAVTSAQTPQQMRMKQCNMDASAQHLMGSRRQAFMRACLSGKHMINRQQQRMRDCNAQAKVKGLSGGRRKTFMSNCLRHG